jgi:hypothetical protein
MGDIEVRQPWKTVEDEKGMFFALFTRASQEVFEVCTRLFAHGLLEAAAVEAIEAVKTYAVRESRAKLIEAAEQNNIGRDNFSGLSVHDFTEVLNLALGNIDHSVLAFGMGAVSEVESAFRELRVDVRPVKLIGEALVGAVFKEIQKVISSHSLMGAPLSDLDSLFDTLVSFGSGTKMKIVDQEFFEKNVKALGQSLVERLHEEYFVSLQQALTSEKWERVEVEERQFQILSKLEIAHDAVLGLGGGATRSLHILLELSFQYVRIAKRMSILADDLARRFFESVQLFALESSKSLLEAGRVVTLPMLALSAAELRFAVQLVLAIKRNFVRSGADESRVISDAMKVADGLDDSCGAIVKRIEDMLIAAVKTELDRDDLEPTWTPGLPNKVLALHAAQLECLPASLYNDVLDGFRMSLYLGYRRVRISQVLALVGLNSGFGSLYRQGSLESASV